MDYEKKYKEALERFKTFREKYCTYGELHFGDVIFDKTGEAQKDLDAIFPELRESEDERMIKAVEHILYENYTDAAVIEGVEIAEIVTWLEKHKEPIDPFDTKLFQDGVKEGRRLEREEMKKGQKPIIQDVELNDAVYDYVRDHFIAGADFTPEYIKKLMENAFFAGVDYYLLKQESESCESDTNIEKVIEDVIRVYGKTQGEWVGGYDVDTLIVNLRRAFNKKEQKPAEGDKTNGWTGVDLERYLSCLQRLGTGNPQQPETINSKWFKEHCHPQPKPAWSEEDEETLEKLHRLLVICRGEKKFIQEADYNKMDNLLKSLRPHWKPSEEQIKALYCALNDAISLYSDKVSPLYEEISRTHFDVLESLYNDLKKLI